MYISRLVITSTSHNLSRCNHYYWNSMKRIPLVVILGATGTGKSRLAIQIAKKFNGEIISADSMQVYEELDIMSNKVTRQERRDVPHYMIDLCAPSEHFSCLDFRNRTLTIIDDIIKRNRLPIIVGGTHYYIESILWKDILLSPVEENPIKLKSQKFHVLKNPEQELGRRKLEESTIKEEIIKNVCLTLDNQIADMKKLFNNFEYVIQKFEKLVWKSIENLRITGDYYSRTFYRLPDSLNVKSFHQFSEKMNEELSFSIIARIEIQLLKEFLYECLENVQIRLQQPKNFHDPNTFLTDVNPYQFWNLEKVKNLLERAECENLNEKFYWRLKRIDQICSKDNIGIDVVILLKKVCDIVAAVMDTRLRRLRLIRIIDDKDMTDFTSEELHSELKLFDLNSAKCIHPSNRRKIIRAIQVFLRTGQTFFQMKQQQREQNYSNQEDTSLRFPDALLLWLRCDSPTLERRLHNRVHDMIQRGLISELKNFFEKYGVRNLNEDGSMKSTAGIYQSIGLKEFHRYLMLDPAQQKSDGGRHILKKAIHQLQLSNFRFAKTQESYVINKFIQLPHFKKIPTIFELDSTDLENWHQLVELKASTLVDLYLRNEVNQLLSYNPVIRGKVNSDRFEQGEFPCDICNLMFHTKYERFLHYTNSQSHRKRLYESRVSQFQKKILTMNHPSKKIPVNEDANDLSEYHLAVQLFI